MQGRQALSAESWRVSSKLSCLSLILVVLLAPLAHTRESAELRDAALRLYRSGVGYYRGLDFVHVDGGRVRQW